MDGSPSAGVIRGPDIPYRANFARTVTRGTCLLEVTLRGDLAGKRAAAAAAAERRGGVDVLARARGSQSGGGANEPREGSHGELWRPRDRRD